MQTLAAKTLQGQWRSFKSFRRSGEIKLFTDKAYKEFELTSNRLLSINSYNEDKVKQEVLTDKWDVVLKTKSFTWR